VIQYIFFYDSKKEYADTKTELMFRQI